MTAIPRTPRATGRMPRLALTAATAAWRLARRRPAPMLDDLGAPASRHPERLDKELPERDGEWLAGLAAALWPAGEYTEIVRAYLPGGGTP
jgi:hypothetical protein